MKPSSSRKLTYEEIELSGKKMLFTDCRIDRSTVPDELHVYDLRHGDEDWDTPCELAEHIVVNYYGSVITDEEFDLAEGPVFFGYNDFGFTDHSPVNGTRIKEYFEECDD